MNKLVSALSIGLLATAASAQACFQADLGNSLGSANDTVHPIQPIGFNFPIGGQTYTDLHISDHGVLWLSNAGTPTPPASGGVTYNVLQSDFVAFGPCIAPFWADANCGYAVSPLGEVFLNNSDPTKCVITWVNMYTYQDQLPAYTFQCVLDVNGSVTFVYDNMTNNYGSTFAAQAIVGVTPAQGALLPAASDLSALPVVTDPSIFEEFTVASTFDGAADGWTFIPTNPGWVTVSLGGNQNQCASATTYGDGCGQAAGGIYELMPASGFDLAGTTLSFLNGGAGQYTVLDSLPGAWMTPSATAQVVAAGDDIEETVALSSALTLPDGRTTNFLTISSNGQITLSDTGNGAGFTPDAALFTTSPQPGFGVCWHDFQPNAAGSGQITFEEVGSMAVVTWTNVYNWGTTTGETFQAQFNLSTGDVQILFDATWNNQGNGYLVGYTPGAGTLDPGATDLSTALAVPVQVASIETLPLEIGSNAPRLGQNWDLTTSNIDPISPIAITFFGDGTQGAGVPLSVIGLNAPGCSIWLNTLVGSLTGVSASGSATVTVPIPNNPVLAGQGLTAQSVCLTLRNSANLLTSGGVLGNLGL